MLNLIFESMRYEHLDEISELEKQCFNRPWSKKSLESELSNKNAVFTVAKLNDKIVGYVGMYDILKEGYINNIAVNKKFRNMGVGTELLNYLIRYANNNDLEFITLEVRESNDNAIRLYKKLGFKKVGIRKNFYSNPLENAILFTKYMRKEK